MAKFFDTILIFLLVLAFGNGSAQTTNRTVNDLYPDTRPYTRWWWFAADMDTVDIQNQLDWLKEYGFGGVEIAWVYPMFAKKDTPRPAWLSKEWSSLVGFAKRYSDHIGLGCDFTYGTLWPFNDPDLIDEDGSRKYHDTISPFQRKTTWEYPKKTKILNHLSRTAFESYADKMDKGLENAYKGRSSAIFVDSWEVNAKFLWTKGFGKRFRAVHGYELEPFIDSMYQKGSEDIYYDYMKVLSSYIIHDFYEPFTVRAHQNNAFSRAQCGGAPADLLRAFSVVDIPETEAILYEPNFSRIPASAAALTGKPIVTSESFTCLYGWRGWGPDAKGKGPHQNEEQVADMKLVADALFANGTNHIIWHGTPFNKTGDTTNYFFASVHVGPNSGFVDELKSFNGYLEKVAGYMRKGKTYSDIAVYMPLEDSWMPVFYPDSLQKPWTWGAYELRYIFTPDVFKGRQPLWVNDFFLSQATVENGKLYCGDLVFSGLSVNVDYLDMQALQTILRLARKGLPVWLEKTPKQPGKNKNTQFNTLVNRLKSLPNVSGSSSIFSGKALIEGDDLPDFWCREDQDAYYVFFANPYAKGLKYPLRYKQGIEDQGSIRSIAINVNKMKKEIALDFKPMQSILLKIEKSGNIETVDLGF